MRELSEECFDFGPFVATIGDDDLYFVTSESGKFFSFNFLGSYQHESKCHVPGISLRMQHLFSDSSLDHSQLGRSSKQLQLLLRSTGFVSTCDLFREHREPGALKNLASL